MAALSSGVKRSFDAYRSDIRDARPNRSTDLTDGFKSHFAGDVLLRQETDPPTRSEPVSRNPSPSIYQETRAPPPRTPRSFSPSASLLLTGIRGTGKSSLGVIASKALQRPIIDADDYFARYSGSSRTVYRQQHGPKAYAIQEERVLRELFGKHGTGYIIVCGPSGALDSSGSNPFREFAYSHPVVFLVRDAKSLASYLRVQDTNKIGRLVELCGPAYRSSSNFEFFNVSETANKHQQLVTDESLKNLREVPETPFLTLKSVEYDFVRLLRHIFGEALLSPNPDGTSSFSMIPLMVRDHTYAVSVLLSRLQGGDVNINDLAVNADAFEIVIDCIGADSEPRLSTSQLFDCISLQCARVRRHTVIPIIYHVDMNVLLQQNRMTDIRKFYLDLVHHGHRLGVEFITVDLSLDDFEIREIIAAKALGNSPGARIIGHLSHAEAQGFSWDDTYMQLYRRAQSLGCDIVRLSKPATTIEDNFAVQRAVQRVQTTGQAGDSIPLIAYNTGPIGRMSCCFNGLFTPVTHPSIRTGQARNMITAAEAQEALFKTFVQDPLQFYVFGGAIQHSLSPAMHNAAFRAVGIPHRYSIRQAAKFEEVAYLLNDENFGGCSIGLPFKMDTAEYCTSLSPSAKAIGAINTIIPIREDLPVADSDRNLTFYHGRNRAGIVKELRGYNTDWVGILNALRENLSPVNAVGPRTSGLVCGAGGMARASIYALIQLGIRQIFIYNRTVENANMIAQHFMSQDSEALTTNFASMKSGPADKINITVLQSKSEALPEGYRQPTVVVSTVPFDAPAGLPPPEFTLPEQWLQSPTGGVVLELSYNTLVTHLMRQMRAVQYYSRGWVFMDGLEVLPRQGAPQFELFTGRRAPRRLMTAEVLRAYQATRTGEDDEAGVGQRLEDIESPAVTA